MRRKYAKFQPDDRPKKLPHAGHPDWEEWQPPERQRYTLPASFERNVLLACIAQAKDDALHGNTINKWDAIKWFRETGDWPGSFRWMARLVDIDADWFMSKFGATFRLPSRNAWKWAVADQRVWDSWDDRGSLQDIRKKFLRYGIPERILEADEREVRAK